MNERIKEFAEQADKLADDTLQMVGEFHPNWHEVRDQKFAKLIINDCIDTIESYRIPVGNSAAGELACEWTYVALKEIRDEIKEHFGV